MTAILKKKKKKKKEKYHGLSTGHVPGQSTLAQRQGIG